MSKKVVYRDKMECRGGFFVQEVRLCGQNGMPGKVFCPRKLFIWTKWNAANGFLSKKSVSVDKMKGIKVAFVLVKGFINVSWRLFT